MLRRYCGRQSKRTGGCAPIPPIKTIPDDRGRPLRRAGLRCSIGVLEVSTDGGGRGPSRGKSTRRVRCSMSACLLVFDHHLVCRLVRWAGFLWRVRRVVDWSHVGQVFVCTDGPRRGDSGSTRVWTARPTLF